MAQRSGTGGDRGPRGGGGRGGASGGAGKGGGGKAGGGQGGQGKGGQGKGGDKAGQGKGGQGKGGQGKGGDKAGQGKAGQGKGGQGKGGQGKGGGQCRGGGQGRGGRGKPGARRRDDGTDETAAKLSGPLKQVLGRLPETQRRVLELRMGLADGHPHDLADTARELGLSMSEAREIEKRAFEHIREAVPLQQLQRFLGS
jgi:hypothetical protein